MVVPNNHDSYKNDHFGVFWDTTIYGNTHLLNKQIASQIP